MPDGQYTYTDTLIFNCGGCRLTNEIESLTVAKDKFFKCGKTKLFENSKLMRAKVW